MPRATTQVRITVEAEVSETWTADATLGEVQKRTMLRVSGALVRRLTGSALLPEDRDVSFKILEYTHPEVKAVK